MYTWLLISNPCTLGCVHKSKYFWSFPSCVSQPLDSWPFICPYDCSYSTLHYPFGFLYKEPLEYIEEGGLKRKKTIVHCCHSLHILESASLCPFGALCVLPNISFSCELAIEIWRIEVVEVYVEVSVSPVRRRANRGCHLCNLWFD